MKFVLFCNLPYAFSILKPLEAEIIKRGDTPLWFIPDSIRSQFPYEEGSITSNISDLINFDSDIIFVPGNEVPYFLSGLKVQIFHGLAGEKKGHFRIRGYFDLYLTQGPYFTQKFTQLSRQYQNFDVIETGWCKLDALFTVSVQTLSKKEDLLHTFGAKKIVLYAPTFSPSLTSGEALINVIEELSKQKDFIVIIKFHDKMANEIKEQYTQILSKHLLISDENDIIPLLQIADIMISDTSSVVYEFVLLNKPVVTLNSHSQNINWANVDSPDALKTEVINILSGNDLFSNARQTTINEYHPYHDGKSATRMVQAAIEYANRHGIPKRRKIPFFNRLKTHLKYGYWPKIFT